MTQEEIDQLVEAYNRIWGLNHKITVDPTQINPILHTHDKDDDYNPWFVDPDGEWQKKADRETKKVECDCGAHKIKDAGHSSWCSINDLVK